MYSDHRGMFVDLDMELLFGNLDNVLATMQYRDFKARDPKAVTDYLTAVDAYLTEHTFHDRLTRTKPIPATTTLLTH